MGKLSKVRAIALAASLAAVYALVLNVILASTLLAAQSPLQLLAGHQFCLASADADALPVEPGKAKPAAIHCPLCVGQHVSAAPPPTAPALAIRLAFGIAYDPPRVTPFVALTQSRDHQPRGPPALT
ncbi:DUF2946 family protein [Rhodopseudomonas palustris]|uniref:DUF2946 family protein n=1 Tax=Rhodopseudomonas palustris TaxID=1076 RepID=UPI002ACD6430|nr:DUF2946 family protein [Rhodopseudomonas palustris]WQH00082.1 DUF2946 family protein [Rhodopseudomonas palustris]